MTFLYLSSDAMGAGDDALGRKLLLKFLEELAAAEDVRVDIVGCVNRGALLTQNDSGALSSLQALERRGARIATCGTCLDHFGLREGLDVGQVGDMATTVRVMAEADRVIRPC